METTDKKPVDNGRNRVINSAIYRRKIKRMVERTKTLRDIPHGTKIPKGPRTTLKANADEATKMAHAKVNNNRLTIDVIHFFADTVSGYVPKREEKSSVEQAISEVEAAQSKK